ncbi:MAG: ferritin-like protein [Gemmatimonadales bacterium]|nr:ferritin-like protein [Gemmatimonadales bacterium]
MPITTRSSLARHLQWALELEHATIPPYLCALYSIRPGTNAEAAEAIRSVVLEKMRHLTLVANLLNAIGGKPALDDSRFVPSYPTTLPHSNGRIRVHLRPLSPAALETFRAIERPAPPPGPPPEGDAYETIGQFHAAIADGFRRVAARVGERRLFRGRRTRQVGPEAYDGAGGGRVVVVTDVASALAAIAEVSGQRQRHDPATCEAEARSAWATGAEPAIDWAGVWPMRPDPRMARYRGRPDVHALMLACNARYADLLRALHDAFNGRPARLREAVPIMHDLRHRAQALMAVPTGEADGTTVGPSFELAAAPRVRRAAASRGGRGGGRARRSAGPA